jgi:hypothetical protein
VNAQEKPKVFVSDDFYLEGASAYLWFYTSKGVLSEKLHVVNDQETINVLKGFAKNCNCEVVKEPDEADYVVVVSRDDLVFHPKLAEKKFIVLKVDGEQLVTKGSVHRVGSIVSDACKAILKDWQKSSD